MIKTKIGLVGTGHMGTSILNGVLANRIAVPGQVRVYDKLRKRAKAFGRRAGIRVSPGLDDLIDFADWILLAVKPQDLENAGKEIRPQLKKKHTVCSILAGTPVRKLRSVLGPRPAIIRAMPNLGAGVGASMTVLCGSSRTALDRASAIFRGCGSVTRLNEKKMDLVTALSGSGPAYFFYLMEQLTAFGMEQGLSASQARTLAVETAYGASLLARTCREAPGELRRRVTSPGGTTEAALKRFASEKLPSALKKGFHDALKRGRQLSGTGRR